MIDWTEEEEEKNDSRDEGSRFVVAKERKKEIVIWNISVFHYALCAKGFFPRQKRNIKNRGAKVNFIIGF